MLFRHGESRILSVNCSNLALVRGEEMTAQVNAGRSPQTTPTRT